MILVLLRHTPNPSSKFIDLDVEILCARGNFAKFEPSLYTIWETPVFVRTRWTKTPIYFFLCMIRRVGQAKVLGVMVSCGHDTRWL